MSVRILRRLDDPSGTVVRAKQLMHGKTSPVFHGNQGVFEGLRGTTRRGG